MVSVQLLLSVTITLYTPSETLLKIKLFETVNDYNVIADFFSIILNTI